MDDDCSFGCAVFHLVNCVQSTLLQHGNADSLHNAPSELLVRTSWVWFQDEGLWQTEVVHMSIWVVCKNSEIGNVVLVFLSHRGGVLSDCSCLEHYSSQTHLCLLNVLFMQF